MIVLFIRSVQNINSSFDFYSLAEYCNATRDPLIPSIWGPVSKEEDPFAPAAGGSGGSGGCCIVMQLITHRSSFSFLYYIYPLSYSMRGRTNQFISLLSPLITIIIHTLTQLTQKDAKTLSFSYYSSIIFFYPLFILFYIYYFVNTSI